MPIALLINEPKHVLVATATGDLHLADLQSFIRTVRVGDRRDWPLLFDAINATSHITSDDHIGGALLTFEPLGTCLESTT